MATLTRALPLLGLAAVVVAPATGRTQTQLDFDVCNQQATAQAASPSASPAPAPEPGGFRGDSMTSPGGSLEANRQPNASGRMSGSAGSPGTGAGTTGGGLSGTTTGGPLAVDAGPRRRGVASAGASDEPYRRAYRECMKARGF